jgi:DNA repair protein RadD
MAGLREYQQRAIDQLYAWFEEHETGNPCLVLPTGSGKSWIVAALCRDVVRRWDARILMLTHQKELIEQNAEKLKMIWPGAPLGIYSASVGRKELGEPITFAGIQSVRSKAQLLGHIDLIVIDECHLVSHKQEGSYRLLIDALTVINPAVRVVGLTATPYRLGHGLITDAPALFDALIEPVSIDELIHLGYLATLRSKVTEAHLDTSGVAKRGGEFVESDLQKAVDHDDINAAIVDEVIRLAGDRRSWLFFCTGVEHAEHIRDCLIDRGIWAEAVTGSMGKTERARILNDFKDGTIQALTSMGVLTTGFDAPNTDLIAMLRPTMSASLYVQMAGRGMRPKEHTDHCLVLDFAGVVRQHGPITNVEPPPKKGEKSGEAPVKLCDDCGEFVHISVMKCPSCGYEFPPLPKPPPELHQDDIMGREDTIHTLKVTDWLWTVQESRKTGIEMIVVTYIGGFGVPSVREYLTVMHDGYAGRMGMKKLHAIAAGGRVDLPEDGDIYDLASHMQKKAFTPNQITYKMAGKFPEIIDRSWQDEAPLS